MSRKKLFTIAICVLVAVAALSAAVYAAVSYGSQDDPLISKSYLDEVLAPKLEADFQAELDAAMANIEKQESSDFAVISLTKGQTVSCGVGCEVMLRIGSAEALGADYPVLVDSTNGDSVSNGSALKSNHLYLVTIAGNGFKATAGTTKLLIRGNYTVN